MTGPEELGVQAGSFGRLVKDAGNPRCDAIFPMGRAQIQLSPSYYLLKEICQHYRWLDVSDCHRRLRTPDPHDLDAS